VLVLVLHALTRQQEITTPLLGLSIVTTVDIQGAQAVPSDHTTLAAAVQVLACVSVVRMLFLVPITLDQVP